MTDSITAHPLCWPAGWKRTENHLRSRAKFHKQSWKDSAKHRVSIHEGTQRVLTQLERMGVDSRNDVVISSDLVLRMDGLPRSGQRDPDDPGVAVYWQVANKEQRCMAVDRYDRIGDNLAAIAATLDAMRAIERHGGAEILDRAFTGFTALPAPGTEPWWSVLGFYNEAEALFQGDFEIRARKLMKKHHSDTGDGDDWKFAQVRKARDDGRAVRDAK